MGMRILAKMNPGDICNPLDLLRENNVADTDTKTVVLMGSIVGLATGLSYRKNSYGDQPSVALTGVFEAIPADSKMDGARAPALFLSQAVQAIMVSTMLGEQESPVTKMPKQGERIDIQTGKTLKILCEISVRRNAATGGAGYEFIISQAGTPEKIDILESLKLEMGGGAATQIGSNTVKQLASQSTGRAEHNPAPSKTKKKSAKK